METLILANLTDEERYAFERAHIPFSGTSGGVKGEPWKGLGPCIATSIRELQPSLQALDWQHVSLEKRGDTWIARKQQHSRAS